LPALNSLLGRHLDAAILYRPAALTAYAAILLATTLFAGGYPALLISSSRIGQALKSKSLFHGSRTTLRNALVTGQFTIAVVFIVSLIVFLKQLHFLQNKDLGYSYDQIVTIPLNSKAQLKIDGIRSELAKISGVNSTAFGWTELGSGGALMGVDYTTAKGEQTRMSVNFENASSNYLRFFQMKVIRGSDFSKEPQNEYIINETLAKQLGFADPIGRPINMPGMANGHIVGVVNDYNYGSLRSRIEPLLIGSFPEGAGWKDNLYLKISTVNISTTLKEVGATMARVTGEGTPEWHFLDEHFKELNRSEQQASTIIGIIGALAIGIACLGLLGLAAFVIVHRAKEISIRKVLGASVTRLAMQLSTSFLKWVAVAFVIATPITWWLTNAWLQNFAYRISVSAWMFAAAAVVAVGTALLTVGVLAIKAAMANPINNLHSE
jgi:putative ABC transport system permease protein